MTSLSPEKAVATQSCRHSFPPGFLWGVATAAYQIEGAVTEDGRGECIWTQLCRRPGAIADGESGTFACDHYHRMEADLDLMASLGVKLYRFSVAWPRVLPAGTGAVNAKGLDFYERLVDGLLARGIVPLPTLYHWDLPATLEAKGGWRSRATASAFAEYARVVLARLGDRVRRWSTFNEPFCIVELGHRTGVHAPGAKEPERVVRQIYHNLLLAHGLAAQAMRTAAPKVEVGFVQLAGVTDPLDEDPATIQAAKAAFHRDNAWILDPLFRGEYPKDLWAQLGKDVPEIAPGDMKIIGAGLDWLGINCYNAWNYVLPDGSTHAPEKWHPRTDMDWPITPDALYWALRFVHEEYKPAHLIVTESGCAFPDQVNADGEVMDYARVAYLRQYLRGVHRAIEEGVPVDGYAAWSLMDNFEWAYGYSKRFGLVHVNFENYTRTPKLSAKWYARTIERNGM